MPSSMLVAMPKIAPFFAVVCAIALATSAQAAPPQSQNDFDKQLTDKGFLVKLEGARQNMSQRASTLVVDAIGFLGVPYKRGGTSAETGFDCSGFVRAMYQQSAGFLLPRRADQQAAATQVVDKHEMQPGDLVFFNTMRRTFSHVGIYIGEGQFIHSPKPGAQVRVEKLSVGYWTKRFDGARRVAVPAPPAGNASFDAAPVLSANAGLIQATDLQALRNAEVSYVSPFENSRP